MRYVSELLPDDQNGIAEHYKSCLFGQGSLGNVIVCDMETGMSGKYAVSSLARTDTLGVGISSKFRSELVVRHTNKTALLHTHIDRARTVKYEPGSGVAGADTCVLSCGKAHDYLPGCRNSEALSINTTHNSIEVCGLLGSVTTYASKIKDRPMIYTLYDLLGKLCRDTKINLMRYRTLFLWSELCELSTIIRFSCDEKSKAFLDKMYIDVMS